MSSTAVDFSFLRQLILSRSENHLDPGRDHLFEARLRRLLQERGMKGLDELVHRLRYAPDPALEQAVVEAMTNNETSFFRDRSPFDLMRDELLPALIERRAKERTLRLWSAACSSGQEALSLAMLLREHFPQLAGWQIEVLGTDIHAEMVRRAQAARYQRMEVNRGLPARFLLKYFVRDGEEWEAAPELRAMCLFQQRSLANALPVFGRYDGILLRNVLIYLPDETRQRIIQRMHTMLAPDGFLILGSGEQATMPELWQPILSRNTCYYKPR